MVHHRWCGGSCPHYYFNKAKIFGPINRWHFICTGIDVIPFLAKALSFTPKLWAKFLVFMSAVYAWSATWDDPPSILKLYHLMSGLSSLVEAQTNATRTSTSVVFALGPLNCTLSLTVALHWPSHASQRQSLWNIHLKFTVNGWSKQASMHRYIHTCVM